MYVVTAEHIREVFDRFEDACNDNGDDFQKDTLQELKKEILQEQIHVPQIQ